MAASLPDGVFDDAYAFNDEVHGTVMLNRLERDCVDTPEFQRLFRISQLGFVDLLYPSADHKRGSHSIGACVVAKRLVKCLNDNHGFIAASRLKAGKKVDAVPRITPSESALISLAGLLHDIPHGPLSHDIEKKTHRYSQDGKDVKVKSFYGP
jgi:HD superfamily phosphohydrolase